MREETKVGLRVCSGTWINSRDQIELLVAIVQELSWKMFGVGFCGADESVETSELVDISKNAPWVEWGILFRADKEGLPRYPRLPWVRKLADEVTRVSNDGECPKIRLAAHICGERCNEILQGHHEFASSLYKLGFRRVQLNTTKQNGVDCEDLASKATNVATVMRALPKIEWILQRNAETKDFCKALLSMNLSNVSLLLDESAGCGVERTSFPYTDEESKRPCGYAGGIGPINIKETIRQVSRSTRKTLSLAPGIHHPFSIWIDMESSLRGKTSDGDEIFALNAVKECVNFVREELEPR